MKLVALTLLCGSIGLALALATLHVLDTKECADLLISSRGATVTIGQRCTYRNSTGAINRETFKIKPEYEHAFRRVIQAPPAEPNTCNGHSRCIYYIAPEKGLEIKAHKMVESNP